MEFSKNPTLHQAAHDLAMSIVKEKISQSTIGSEPENNEIVYITEMYRKIYAKAVIELQN